MHKKMFATKLQRREIHQETSSTHNNQRTSLFTVNFHHFKKCAELLDTWHTRPSWVTFIFPLSLGQTVLNSDRLGQSKV